MRWSLFQENGNWVIRRWHQGKYERLPIKQYKRIRNDAELLREFVSRLNAPLDTQDKVEFKHAFISPKLLEEYREYLIAQIPTRTNALCEFAYLKDYFLNYFIGELDLMNPLDWYQVHETKWANFLLSKKAPGSAKTKKDIVIAANRFVRWLHKKRPEDMPLLDFRPISKAKYKQIEAQRELDGEIKERKLITDKDCAKILKESGRLEPFIRLGLAYGLRRSEVLGVQAGDTKRGYLQVDRQLVKITPDASYKPLKGRDCRQVPHWFATAAQAYRWVEAVQADLMHPDTLSGRWAALMAHLDLEYDFHDLRHTFITKAIRLHNPRDVQLAAGHKDIRTTMGYAHDDRTLDDEEYIPA